MAGCRRSMRRGLTAFESEQIGCTLSRRGLADIRASSKQRDMERSRKAFPIVLLVVAGQTCIAQGTFNATGSMTVTRRGHTATLLADGRVLMAGGWANLESAANSLSSAEVYDPATGTFSSTR